jgi:hypothetical protein
MMQALQAAQLVAAAEGRSRALATRKKIIAGSRHVFTQSFFFFVPLLTSRSDFCPTQSSMRLLIPLLALLLALCQPSSSALQTVQVQLNTSAAIGSISPLFASFGWEMDQMLGMVSSGALNDARFAAAASGLAPAVIRVGGITGDWVRYTGFEGGAAAPRGASEPLLPLGYWPSAPNNLTLSDFSTLLDFMQASNLTLIFMLSELYGRNCNTTKPGCPSCSDWCTGPWDTSNVRSFLQYVHDHSLTQGGSPLVSFELGNELVSHMYAANTTADIVELAGIIQSIWADVPEAQRPGLYAPSTDDCSDAGQMQIMANITSVPGVLGFSEHKS